MGTADANSMHLYDLVFNPFEGSYLTYGQGPEHQWFTQVQRPADQQPTYEPQAGPQLISSTGLDPSVDPNAQQPSAFGMLGSAAVPYLGSKVGAAWQANPAGGFTGAVKDTATGIGTMAQDAAGTAYDKVAGFGQKVSDFFNPPPLTSNLTSGGQQGLYGSVVNPGATASTGQSALGSAGQQALYGGESIASPVSYLTPDVAPPPGTQLASLTGEAASGGGATLSDAGSVLGSSSASSTGATSGLTQGGAANIGEAGASQIPGSWSAGMPSNVGSNSGLVAGGYSPPAAEQFGNWAAGQGATGTAAAEMSGQSAASGFFDKTGFGDWGNVGGGVGAGLMTFGLDLINGKSIGGSLRDGAFTGAGTYAGAAIGSAFGPIGTFVGGAIGGMIGGAVSSIFCHAAGTPILMEDGSTKPVEDLRIGDRVALGGMVLGRGEALAGEVFSYKETTITGEHPVFEDGRWVRVQDSPLAVPVELAEPMVVYPVYTEWNVMATTTYVCSDYAEVPDGHLMTRDDRLAMLNWNAERNARLMEAEGMITHALAA